MAPSTCQDGAGRTYPNAGWAPAAKTGVLAQWSGIRQYGNHRGSDQSHPSLDEPQPPNRAIADRAGCSFGSGTTDLDHVRRDIAYIPNQDVFGNNANCCYQTPQNLHQRRLLRLHAPRPPILGRASPRPTPWTTRRSACAATRGLRR